jgi:hypothetical protein
MPGRSALNGEEPLKREGCGLHGLHGAGREPPVVTRKDSAEMESPATEYRFGRDDAAG